MSNVGNYAKDPAAVLKTNLEKGYVGVRIEQGVPLLERDLNLQSELLAAVQRSILERYVGNGTNLATTAFQVVACNPVKDTFKVLNGDALVGGIEVNTGTFEYNTKDPESPLLPWKPGDDPRTDVVYVDAWLEEDGDFPDSNNAGDVQHRTSVRLKPKCKVRVAIGAPNQTAQVPAAALGSGHAYYKLAEIKRTSEKIQPADITDKRVVNLNLAWLVQQLDQLQVDIAKIKTALAPRFSTVRQFDRAQGYTGRFVTLYGYNFHLGTVTVDITVNGVTTLGTQQNGCKIVGDILPNALTLEIGSTWGGGATVFKVNTGFGSATSTLPFRVLGQVVFDAVPWSGSKPIDSNVLVLGDFFDCPNVEFQAARVGTENWFALTVVATTQTTATIKAPHDAGTYKLRARNDAGSPTWNQCETTMTVTA